MIAQYSQKWKEQLYIFGRNAHSGHNQMCVDSVGNGFIRSVGLGASSECMNAFPTRGGGRFGYDEGPVSGAQCVQSVGAGLPDRPAVGSYRYNQAQANPSPGSRAGGDACPYERRWAFRL